MLDGLFTFEPMRETDRAFVLDSWLRSYLESPLGTALGGDRFFLHQRPVSERLLRACRVVVARPLDWPEGIAGWACADSAPGVFVLHYAVVKRDYRRIGVGRRMLAELGLGEQAVKVFTHRRPPWTDALNRHGFRWEPKARGAQWLQNMST